MKKIVLLRHGESVWNRENRFTGWTDVDLSEKGVAEAVKAGETLRKEGFHFGRAYTSYLKRAVKTLDVVIDRMDRDWIPVTKTWRLNEKHYGMLQGLNKRETAEKYGDEQVYVWRRSYDVAPAPLPEDDPRNPRFDLRYAGTRRRTAPHRVVERHRGLHDALLGVRDTPALARHDELLVVAHGNSLRGIIKNLKGISDEAISEFNLPTAAYVFESDEGLGCVKDHFGRPGRDRLPDGGRRQSGPAGLTPPPHFRCARRRFRRQSSADPFLIRFCVWGAEPVLRADGLHPTENDAAP